MYLSIIVPIYNVEKYIKECLDSLCVQSPKDIEILLIDDGSSDDSSRIAKEYVEKDSRFIYFRKDNGGLSDARNYGVVRAKSDYIFFVDSDDYIANNACELIIESLKKKPDCVVFDVMYFWDNSNKTKLVKGIADVESDMKGKLLAAAPSAWNKVFKKELHLKYPEPIKRFYEDVATTPLIVSECNNIEYIDKPLYFYRQREGSIIYTYDDRTLDIFQDFKEVFDYYKRNELFERYYEVLEYLAVEHILLYANRRFLKMSNAKELMTKSRDFVKNYFVKPLQNKYFQKMSKNDKLFIWLAYNGKVDMINSIIKLKRLFK